MGTFRIGVFAGLLASGCLWPAMDVGDSYGNIDAGADADVWGSGGNVAGVSYPLPAGGYNQGGKNESGGLALTGGQGFGGATTGGIGAGGNSAGSNAMAGAASMGGRASGGLTSIGTPGTVATGGHSLSGGQVATGGHGQQQQRAVQ